MSGIGSSASSGCSRALGGLAGLEATGRAPCTSPFSPAGRSNPPPAPQHPSRFEVFQHEGGAQLVVDAAVPLLRAVADQPSRTGALRDIGRAEDVHPVDVLQLALEDVLEPMTTAQFVHRNQRRLYLGTQPANQFVQPLGIGLPQDRWSRTRSPLGRQGRPPCGSLCCHTPRRSAITAPPCPGASSGRP